MAELTQLPVGEFVRTLKDKVDNFSDSKFVFFIGAGCSISSGIPGAADLVKKWLPRIKKIKKGNDDNLDEWAKEQYNGYSPEQAAQFYPQVIKDLYPNPEDQQREIEKHMEGKNPRFGYSVLAQLMTLEQYARQFNFVLTVNFDDLIADALYYYTNKKPLVIYHESLAQYARILRVRPTIVKLHGDAKIQPLSSLEDTKELHERFKRKVKALLSEAGIIFLGYGGNDESITSILDELPEDSLPESIFWVNDHVPATDFGEWLKKRNATWVNHLDFDKFMAQMFGVFNLKLLDEDIKSRSERILNDYRKSVEELVEKTGAKPEEQELSDALSKAVSSAESWWAVELEARRYRESDPNKVNKIYLMGVKKFPDSFQLANNFAIFLEVIRNDYVGAREFYEKALELNESDAVITGNYAAFLMDKCNDHDKAELLYVKALRLDPYDAGNTGRYAAFLHSVREHYDKAEELYLKALELDPNNASNTGNYASFLDQARKDYDKAEELYKRALELNPTHVTATGNYASFLKRVRKDHEKAEELYKKALELDPDNVSYIGKYANFLANIRMDYDQAEELYVRALSIDPNHANNTASYGGFLLSRGNIKGLEFVDRALTLPAINIIKRPILLECRFYKYAHSVVDEVRIQSLEQARKMLLDGVRSPYFDLSQNVERAIADGHPEPDFLKVLAKVISDEANISELDKFDVWKEADEKDK
jgi:tetratricopeptide (TPR) repeat protein